MKLVSLTRDGETVRSANNASLFEAAKDGRDTLLVATFLAAGAQTGAVDAACPTALHDTNNWWLLNVMMTLFVNVRTAANAQDADRYKPLLLAANRSGGDGSGGSGGGGGACGVSKAFLIVATGAADREAPGGAP